MAVARIKFPDKRAARETTVIAKEHGVSRFAVRELGRVAERPGLVAELGVDEVEELIAIVEHFPPRVRPLIAAALAAGKASEERERTRPRGPDALPRIRAWRERNG